MARRSAQTVGRTRIRLARLLGEALTKELGRTVKVDPDNLFAAQGWHRTSNSGSNEALRWEGSADIQGFNTGLRLVSYSPMTLILKRGAVALTRDGPGLYHVETASEPDHEVCQKCGDETHKDEAACIHCGASKPWAA